MTASIQYILVSFLFFINNVLIPFVIALAFLFFIWNVAKYFIIKSGSNADRAKARQLAIYGIAAFVIIVVFWGIVNLLVEGIGIGTTNTLTPDYIQRLQI